MARGEVLTFIFLTASAAALGACTADLTTECVPEGADCSDVGATTATTGGGGDGTGGAGGGAEGCPGNPGTYCADVQAIIAAKCSGSVCHSGTTPGACAGGHCSASFYEDTQKDSAICPNAKIFTCMLLRIENGTMPAGAGCTGDPEQDSGNDLCLTQAQQDTFSAWVDSGAPEE